MDDMTDKIISKLVEMDAKIDDMAANMVTKDDLRVQKDDILVSIDRFAKLHEVLDHELVAMRSKYDRLEERLVVLEQRLAV